MSDAMLIAVVILAIYLLIPSKSCASTNAA